MTPLIGTSYLGEGFLMASFVLCLIHLIKPIRHINRFIFALILISFLSLMYGHLSDDFSMLNVVLHSHKDKPFLYKIAGPWSSHEGSMLFWCLLLSLYANVAEALEKDRDVWKTQEVFFVLLSFGFLLFTYITNPFTRLIHPVHQGMDLNPVLQDVSLLIHPPQLYLGTIGFSVPFIQSLSYLRHKVLPKIGRENLFLSLSIGLFFQTLGIVLGSVWAYYELGWGGWWFFDPVENFALIPWMMALITLHLLILSRKNDGIYSWAIIGCLKVFSMCLLSLTLIRAGLLNSVHAFGSDPEKGILLGSIFVLWALVATLFYFRFDGRLFISVPLKKMNIQNLTMIAFAFFMVSLLALILGTLIPVVMDALGETFVLGFDYFIQSFVPPILCAALCLVFVLIQTKWSQKALSKHMGHFGFYVAIVGIALSSFKGGEEEFLMREGETKTIFDHTVFLEKVALEDRPNHTAAIAKVNVDGKISTPEERFYHTQNSLHRETKIITSILNQIHVMAGDIGVNKNTGKGQAIIKIINKPFIMLMWLGFFMMGVGLLISAINAIFRRFELRRRK